MNPTGGEAGQIRSERPFLDADSCQVQRPFDARSGGAVTWEAAPCGCEARTPPGGLGPAAPALKAASVRVGTASQQGLLQRSC